MKKYSGNIVDVVNRKIFKGSLIIKENKIVDIIEEDNSGENYIMPGLIDSHVHIESSMLIPSEFSKLAIKNGTVAVISDPHEIANVLGIEGVKFMINNANKVPLKTYFCAPSCVPATPFETSGSHLSPEEVNELLNLLEVKILGEMMNFPGVVYQDKEVMKKLEYAKKQGAIIDGHIPGITGEMLEKYVSEGISTDHECFSLMEAEEKIKLGMKILIREGSAARNFDTLYPLISKFNKMCMLCTDDSHPDDLIKYGHINKIIKKGLEYGIEIFDLLQTATINPVEHYGLNVGLLQINDNADFIVIDNLKDFNILETVIDGSPVYSHNRILFNSPEEQPINNFISSKIDKSDIEVKSTGQKIKVIEVIDKELLTKTLITAPKVENGIIVSDIPNDILKIVVYNRYQENILPAIGFINGFGIKKGALASSVAHDSHNIIAVGTNDDDIIKAINEIIEHKGGLTYVTEFNYFTIPLEFAGLMTKERAEIVADRYETLNNQIKMAGCNLTSPFMTLSFMALLVIPELKIGDKGLFDVTKFDFTSLHVT